MITPSARFNGHSMYEHWLQVPYDYFGEFTSLGGEKDAHHIPRTIELFAREIVRDGNENAPRLLFLEGGPGNRAPRPAPISGWIDEALKYYRVVLMDQRGTGNSWPLDADTVSRFGSPEIQGSLLACLRQDSIVRDAEQLRQYLQGDEPWSVLGQSFGGFTTVSYLSFAPEGIREAFITGGLPSLNRHAADVYRRTYKETSKKNKKYFARYPQDEGTAWFIAKHLADVEEFLPTGERLTPGRFRQLGLALGGKPGMEKIHYLLDNPFRTFMGERRLRPQFLIGLNDHLSAMHAPLYWGMHELIYAQSMTGSLAWAAHRVRSEFPEFTLPEIERGGAGESDIEAEGYGFHFTGEHVYPWQFTQDPALRGLADSARHLAFRTAWKDLYNPEALAENTVPTAAWVYHADMYVPFEFSMETADTIRGLKPLVTNRFEHDGLRMDPARIFEGLLGAVR